MSELRWYGWGNAAKTFSLEHRPGAWDFLRAALDLSGDESFLPCDFNSIRLRAPRLSDEQLRALRNLTAPSAVKIDAMTRVMHAYGKSYRDLIRLRRGDIPNPPDAVVFPSNEVEVAQIISFCAQNDVTLIPFGGGSSVVGGVEPRDERLTISLDLARLNRVVSVDEISQTATIEAGILGPDLERELNARGLTLGHLPQSFEFSTLGGWIATRGAGLTSTGYGKIEAMTQSVRVVTPHGVIETKNVPATAAGSSILQMIVGSEGTLGVITQATMRVRALPKTKKYQALLFKSFADGVAAIRAMVQSDIVPTTVRLSDEAETKSFFAMREESQGWKAFTERIGLQFLNSMGYSFENGALLILGVEGDSASRIMSAAQAVCKSQSAFSIGEGIAQSWMRDRYETPYLREVLLDRGVLTDTLETATTWDNLDRLHKAFLQAIADATASTESKSLVMTHVSHCYRDGASLYVTFLARMAQKKEIEQWETIKRAATDCIMTNGGTLSHHHGVGYEHAAWMQRENGKVGMDALKALKSALDPKNVMNPGKWLEAEHSMVGLAMEYQERFWNIP
ncbi:MAG: FAD-binding oxidoreductase [Chloroflexi bacterium]|nr:FAD-binding oxidoreductase [Chloroflexota bacterium]